MSSVLNHPHLGIFILAWFVADLLVPLLIHAARKLDILDRPGGHKGQRTPVPFVGGLGIFVAFAVAVASTLRFETWEHFFPLAGILAGGVVVVVLGLLDDFRPINAIIKLVILFGTTLLLASFGVSLDLFPTGSLEALNIIVTLFWIVGVTSAMNSLDNSDGVAGGVSCISSLFLFMIAWGTSPADAQPCLSYLAIALAGACLGFLRYNFAPARIYLGDNGSFFLGFALATLLVFAGYSPDPCKAMIIPCLILAVPLFDIVLVTVLRIRDREVSSIAGAVLYCGRDHVAHLLQALGLSKRQTACAIYALSAVGGFTALLVLAAPAPTTYLTITACFGVFLLTLGAMLGRVRRNLPLLEAERERAERRAEFGDRRGPDVATAALAFAGGSIPMAPLRARTREAGTGPAAQATWRHRRRGGPDPRSN